LTVEVYVPSDRRSRPLRRADPQFDVVAIGASAGGVEALHVLVEALPVDFPAPVLIVQHMDPRHRSMLAGLLARRSRLPVKQATNGEAVEPGTVYIAQPDAHLLVREGRLVLTDTKAVHFSRPSIDLLFESVADAYGDRAISVILSGSGVDGADGTRAIKAKGGTTIAQSPASAAHSGMPQAARATGCVDVTLPLEEVGPAIVNLVAPALEMRNE
jgi:two-component system, chemotaxis family, protein-glutamate methylesterase/glutaminase